MSDTTISPNEEHAALFANLVVQNVSMAMIFLGRTPHPESGKTEVDLDHARLFIDTLEMLEAKTRGNLSKDEERFLKQNLMSLRMAYVDASNKAPAQPASAASAASPADAPAPGSAPATPEAKPSPPPAQEEESHKKFSKKY